MKTFQPTFYWTGFIGQDSLLINKPHIQAEGERENRIQDTYILLNTLIEANYQSFTINDVFNIQNYFLKENNWRNVKNGFRKHNVSFVDTPHYFDVPEKINKLFPITVQQFYHKDVEIVKQKLLTFYKNVQTIHPLSDLNGRTFGTIVAYIYHMIISEKVN
jgi:Fic family protein